MNTCVRCSGEKSSPPRTRGSQGNTRGRRSAELRSAWTGQSRPLHDLVRIHRQRLIRLLHEHAGVLGALVDNDLDHDPSAAKAFCVGRSVNPVGLDETPLAARPPVTIEVRVRVLRIFLLMLSPSGIAEVNAVGVLLIPMSNRAERMC